jgi:hypothetical protein
MATFPTLTPSTRVVTTGSNQYQPHLAMTGVHDATLLSNAVRDQQISVTFVGLSTADKDLILNHYDGQLSDFTAFDVPSSLLSGFTAANYLTGGYLWRYAESPQITDQPSDQSGGCVLVHDVALTLISELAALQYAAGADLRLGLSLTAGAATAASSAPAAALTLALSLTAGAATAASEAPAANLTLSLSLDPGAATAS